MKAMQCALPPSVIGADGGDLTRCADAIIA